MFLRQASLFVGLLLSVAFAYSASSSVIELNEEDSIILELKLDRFVLAEAIVAYNNVDATFVSFDEFIAALDYPITIDQKEAWASGWFVNPENTFELKLAEKTLYIRGQPIPLREGFSYAMDDWGTYVDIRDLQQWFDLRLALEMDRLQLIVTSEVEQPIEKKIAREKKRALMQGPSKKKPTYTVLPDRYNAVGLPSFDLRLNTEQTQDGQTYGGSIQGAGDILYHETRFSHSDTSENRPSRTRLTFYRDALSEGEDIFLGITNYSFGDIYSQGDSLVSSSNSGVGLQLQRTLSASADQSFSRRDIEGDAPPGWEVELYRNNLLIDFQTVDDSGRYIFKDVALQFGENIFEIRIFGPQGQQQIRTERLSIGSQLVLPGQWQVFASFLQKDQALIGRAQSGPELQDVKDDLNLTVYYGLATRHTLGLGVNRTSPANQEDERDYARLTWIGAFPFFTSRLDYAYDAMSEGNALSLDVTGRLVSQSFSLSHRTFDEFVSSKNNRGAILEDSEINFFGNIKSLPYTLSFSQTGFASGVERYKTDMQLSYTFKGVRLSNQISTFSDNQDTDLAATGIFSTAFGRGAYQSRGSLSYDAVSGEATSLALNQTIKKENWRLQLQANSTFGEVPRNSLGLSISALWGDAALSFSVQGADDDTYSAGLSIDIGVQTSRNSPHLYTTRPGGISTGRAEAVVFLDNDADLTYSAADTPLENIGFKGRSRWEPLRTNEEGRVVLEEIDARRGTVIHVDTVTLADPYLQPFTPSVKLNSHAGAVQTIYFPVNETIEVEGNVLVDRQGRQQGVGGVPVGLFRDGKRIKLVTTEFDGYYLFTGVLPGEYTVDVVDEEKVMTDYTWQPSAPFMANMENGLALIDDIVLTQATVEAAAEDETE